MRKKITGRGAKQKGANAERELAAILNTLGLPTQKVMGSGAYAGSKADLKVGVNDITKPTDETTCIMRLEVKNCKTNPDHLFEILLSEKGATELAFKHQNQDKVSKGVAYRRTRIQAGDIKNGNYDGMWLVSFPISVAVELIKAKQELEELKKKL